MIPIWHHDLAVRTNSVPLLYAPSHPAALQQGFSMARELQLLKAMLYPFENQK